MNREIKFRAWDTFNEMMVDDPYRFIPSGEHHKQEGDARFDAPFQYYGDWQDEEDGISRPCHIMQFTGLTDKNGLEIYEGDIIELVNDNNDTIRVVCEYGIARRFVMTGGLGVEVDIPSFYFLLANGKKSFPIVRNYAGKHDLDIFEVIGNVYQNPSLLTNK